MRAVALLLAAALLAAGCGKGKEEPRTAASGTGSRPESPSKPAAAAGSQPAAAPASGARRIAGGTALRWKGITFDLPAGWELRRGDDGLALVPAGANPAGVVEEAYLVFHAAELSSIEGDEAQRKAAELAGRLQPGAALQGAAEKGRFGDLEGRTWRFTATAQDGQAALVRIQAFQAGRAVYGLLVLGYAEKVARRDADLAAILGSLAAAPAEAPAPAGVGRELAGSWCYVANVYAQGGGRASNSVLTLRPDGTYAWRAESHSSNPFGSSGMQEHDTGTWSAAGSTLTLRSGGGESRSFTIEKRNHPKNKDPMIVLDGKTYVTVHQRPPW